MALRSRDVLVETVQALRRDDPLVNLLYGGAGNVPTDPVDRDRVFHGDPAAPNPHPVAVAVQVSADGATHSKQVASQSFVVHGTIVATDSWVEANGTLAIHDIHDALDAVAELAPTPGIYAQGRASGGDVIELPDDSGRRILPGYWRFQTHGELY